MLTSIKTRYRILIIQYTVKRTLIIHYIFKRIMIIHCTLKRRLVILYSQEDTDQTLNNGEGRQDTH